MDQEIKNEIETLTPKMMEMSAEYREILMLGRVLHASGYFRDVRDPAQAIVKILWGRELSFSPIVSLSGIHIIEGKPALSSNLMATLIKRSGRYDYRVKVSTDTECVLTFREKNGQRWEAVGESSFTMEDAKRAGVVRPGGSWAKYPKSMLFARALSQGLRTYCPDVSASPIYNPEEMGATVDEEGTVVELPKSARPVEVTEQDIEIKKPNGGPVVANGRAEAAVAPPLAPTNGKAETLPLIPPTQGIECINQKQQEKLRARFRESLSEELRDKSDILLHDFLAFHKYVGSDANPHINLIPVADFTRIGKLAIAHAKTLSGGSDVPF